MGFGHVQGILANFASGTSGTVTLTNNPTQGNLVCVCIQLNSENAPITVKDANNNTYTQSPNSPSSNTTNNALTAQFYLLNAPANASKTINVTWTGTNTGSGMADEFSVTGGTAAFDTDVASSPTYTITAGNVNAPTITPSGSGELLYASAEGVGSITSPTVGGSSPANGWTGGSGGNAAGASTGGQAEYILSASAATAVSMTDNDATDGIASLAMAFSFQSSASITGIGSDLGAARSENRIIGY